MDKAILLESQITAGKELLKILDQSENFKITSAMWFFYPDLNEWKLLLFSPDFKDSKPTLLYTQIADILKKNTIEIIPLESIKLILSNDPLLKLLNDIIQVNGNSIVRMQSNYIRGIYVEDALIYRNIKQKK